MYSLNYPVSAIRTKIRQEFERHRFVAQLPVVDVLLTQSHVEFQVCVSIRFLARGASKPARGGIGIRGLRGWRKFNVDMVQRMLTDI